MKFPTIDGLRAMELGTPGAMRKRLNDLVLAGEKRATAGSMDEYVDNEKEHVGEVLVLVDDDLQPLGRIQVTDVVETRFADVPWSFAQAEGEGDESIDDWRSGHRAFWEREGLKVSDDMPVFLIYFKLI